MNGIVNGVQGFLKNKNIVTILGVIAIITILYFTYNSQIEKQVRPIRNVPYAKETIYPGSMITDEMIGYVDISPIVFNHGDIARFSSEVVGKYVDYNTAIPAGSLFYNEILITEDDLPDSVFTKVKDGDIVARFNVTTETTYGNSIFPGNKIDIYMKAVEKETRQVRWGKLFENVTVIAVKDSMGRDVFSSRSDSTTPAMLIFGLEPGLFSIYSRARYMTDFSVDLIPVPHGGQIEATGGTFLKSEALRDFINSNTIFDADTSDETIEIDDILIEDDDWQNLLPGDD